MERTETRQQRAKARNHLARREAAFGARRIARRQTVAALEHVINSHRALVGGVEFISNIDVVIAIGSCAYDGGRAHHGRATRHGHAVVHHVHIRTRNVIEKKRLRGWIDHVLRDHVSEKLITDDLWIGGAHRLCRIEAGIRM